MGFFALPLWGYLFGGGYTRRGLFSEFYGSSFDCASVLTKSVAEMTFCLGYVFNVTFDVLYDINDIRRRSLGVVSYTSFFVHLKFCNRFIHTYVAS